MFHSEEIELSLMRNMKFKNTTPNKNVTLVIVKPMYSSFEGTEGLKHLCQYGEFMLNFKDNPVGRVVIIMQPEILFTPTHAIPDAFLKYLYLWSEFTNNSIESVKDPEEVEFHDDERVFVAIGGTSNDTKEATTKLFNKIVTSSNAKISVIPGPDVTINGSIKKLVIYDANKDATFRNHSYDHDFSFSKFNPSKFKQGGGKAGPKPAAMFPSFTGIFFNYDCEANPLANKFPQVATSRGVNFPFSGPNPYVFYDSGDHNRDYKIAMRPGESAVQALLRLAPKLKEVVTVEYRGYIESDLNTLDAWMEGIVFKDAKGSSKLRWAKDIPSRDGSKTGDIRIDYTAIVPPGMSHFRNLEEFMSSDMFRKISWAQVFRPANGWMFNINEPITGTDLEHLAGKISDENIRNALHEFAAIISHSKNIDLGALLGIRPSF